MKKQSKRISVPLSEKSLAKLTKQAARNKRKIGPQAAILIEAGLQ